MPYLKKKQNKRKGLKSVTKPSTLGNWKKKEKTKPIQAYGKKI